MGQTMAFRSFTWPNNPEKLHITFHRKVEVEAAEDGLWTLANVARMAREFTGEGVFYGENASQTFSALARTFYDGVVGQLTLPHVQPAYALLTDLELIDEPMEGLLRYKFKFVEVAYPPDEA